MFKNRYASTTVASTIMIASKLGIKFLSTGGIGGVHRESEKTLDISSDLKELEKNNMIVICSGAKSILDMNKTHEMLETLGVCRIGYKTNKVPGFWSEKTDLDVDLKINKIEEIKQIIKNKKILNQSGSILIYNPVPKKFSIKDILIEKYINQANKKLKKNKIFGKKITPFLLKEVSLLSKNITLNANTALILNNAKLAGKIAKKLNNFI